MKQQPFNITTFREGIGVRIMQVDGFSDDEMKELGSMDYREMKDTVLEMIDRRNVGVGTCWHNGYGVYSMYTNSIYPNSIFVEIGTSCD